MNAKNTVLKTTFFLTSFLFGFFLLLAPHPVFAECWCALKTGDCVKKPLVADTCTAECTNDYKADFDKLLFASTLDPCDIQHTQYLAKIEANKSSTPPKPVKASITPTLNVDIPGLSFSSAVSAPCTYDKEGTCTTSNFLADYLTSVYQFLIEASIAIAIIMVMVGGLQYALGAGSPGLIAKGKERIKNALIGLVLLLGVYLILYTANPQMTLLRSLELKEVPFVDLPADDSGPSEGQLTGSLGTQCFLDKFGDPDAIKASQLVTVKLLGKNFHVHKMAADAYTAVAAEIESSGYILKSIGAICPQWTPELHGGSSAAFNKRANANDKSKLSLHSFGVAIDLNSCANPNGTRKDSVCPHDIPDTVINAFKANGFTWGGDFGKHCDAMHFEWHGPCAIGQPYTPTPGPVCCVIYGATENDVINKMIAPSRDACKSLASAYPFETNMDTYTAPCQ